MNTNLLHPIRNKTSQAARFLTEPDGFETSQTVFLKEYGRVFLRPIRLDDESRMVRFHRDLSEDSIHRRYFEQITLDTRTQHERLVGICTNTQDSYAIVAEQHATGHHPAEILAVGRLTTTEKVNEAAFAVLCSDEAEETELPKELLRRLIEVARAHDFVSLTGGLLVSDHDALNLCRASGFNLHTVPEDGIVLVTHTL